MKREDFDTEAWHRLVSHVHARLAELRESNDTVGLSIESTESIRGQIKALKLILALPDEVAPQDDGSPDQALPSRPQGHSWD